MLQERPGEPHAGAVHQHVGIGSVLGQRRLDAGDRIGRGDIERQRGDLDLALRADARPRLSSGSDCRAISSRSCRARANCLASAARCHAERPVIHLHRPQAGVGRQRRRIRPPPTPAPGSRKFLRQTAMVEFAAAVSPSERRHRIQSAPGAHGRLVAS
jgi:hypothetical protein